MYLGGVRQKMTRKKFERINVLKWKMVMVLTTLVLRRTMFLFKRYSNFILMPTVGVYLYIIAMLNNT